jgi:curved DNA-binding protein CbpA
MREDRKSQNEAQAKTRRPLTYYDVLDLDRDATPEEIKQAYYELAREHHPDVASDDPGVAERFALISEAYRVLSDQQRRRQYDRTLPQKSYPLRHPTPQKIWREATEVVLIRSDRFGPLNQAMQAAVSITLDGDLLVITMPGRERHLAGHMETASNRNAILNALELVSGRRIRFRVIDGTTLEDWETLKAAESKAKTVRTTGTETRVGRAQPAPGPGEGEWDELIQRVHRQYQQLPKRQYPQSKARFMHEALGWIARTDENLRYDAGADEDAHERALARAIERLASVLDLPPTLVAVQLDALKRSGEI